LVATFSKPGYLYGFSVYFSGMKVVWYSKKWVVVLLHAAVWILLFSLPFLLRRSYGNEKPEASKEEVSALFAAMFYVLSNLIWVGFFYLNAYGIVTRFIYKNKYWQYIVSVIVCFIIILFLQAIVFINLRHPPHFNLSNHILFNLFVFLFFLASSIAFRLISDKSKADRIAKEKENENLKTELSLLRSQASPHFMFNVLNNMVALARKNSDQLEPSLIKLSSLMRYMVYEADEEQVALEKEIEYLQSYIDLQQQRVGKNVKITTSFEHIESGHSIEPMLLIPFVENAFKHGTGFISVNKVAGSDLVLYNTAEINIHLTVEKSILKFSVQNRFNKDSPETKDKTSGVGLTNVKRRLNLLYDKNHTLLISKKDGWFTVSLQLNMH
jgi:two-component system LytT family sensor kinase